LKSFSFLVSRSRYIAAMQIVVDRASSEPPFSQVSSQIAKAVAAGELSVGARLPTVRSLAEQLEVAAGTVARAYRELVAGGVLDTRGRHGTFVADPSEDRTRHRRELADLATAYAASATGLGIGSAEALDLVEQALRSSGQEA
jgi:DNA-binding transcriptional regulator YhcF (GntR family)